MKIITVGETVYDIIFNNNKPLHAKAGGAMLNSSVSLGRLGVPVVFISEFGKDRVGDSIKYFLEENNINTDFVYRYDNGMTALALAFLDENSNAHYTFYKLYPDERLKVQFPSISRNDIVLFGSFFAITSEVYEKLNIFVSDANFNGAIILYDPNFREPHLNDLPKVINLIEKNISQSDIIRGSDEDFRLIFNCKNADETFEMVQSFGGSYLIFTVGSKNVEFRSPNLKFSSPVPKIKTKSTIGAGDSFNAGIIFSLYKNQIQKEQLPDLTEVQWKQIIGMGIRFGSEVCRSFDNYISLSFAKRSL
ncbi:MAG: carbohydrate kinase [Bacteroidales bacterium]|nr:carbohydrate kinase [Bacteroidales bacterium]